MLTSWEFLPRIGMFLKLWRFAWLLQVYMVMMTWINYWVRCLFCGLQSFFIWIGGSDALLSGANILCFDQYELDFFLRLNYQDQSSFELFTGWSKSFCLVRTEKIRVLVSRLHHCEDALAFRFWSWGSSSWHPLWKVYKVCQLPSQVFRHPNLGRHELDFIMGQSSWVLMLGLVLTF